MIAAVLWVALAAPADAAGDVRAAAAAEAAAFAALDEQRDCDAAAAFLRAFVLVRDQRLLLNAGLAFERAGDAGAARTVLEAIDDDVIAAKAAVRLAALPPEALRCPGTGDDYPASVVAAPTTPTTTTTTLPTPAPTEPKTTEPVPLLGISLFSLGGGALVGVAVGGGALLQDSVLHDAGSAGTSKKLAMAASWPLLAAGVVAGVLVVGGGVLLPVSLLGEDPG